MSEIDLLIVFIVGLSALLSYFRGGAREWLGAFIWILAVGVTFLFASRLASVLPIDTVQSPLARATISALVLFFGTLLLGRFVRWWFFSAVSRSTLSVGDRIAGVIFGVIRGLLIVTLLVLAANLSPDIKREPWWQKSRFIPHFQSLAVRVHKRLPPELRRHFDISYTST